MTEETQYDVFLSHNSADKPAVEELARRLVNVGIQPWLDKWNLVPGEPWQEGLEEALDACQTVAVFLGPSGIGSWENEEMRSALEERVRDKSRRVIPVLLPGAPDPREKPLPRFLRRMTWVDFRGGLDDEDAFRRLVAGIRGVVPGASGATPAPAAARPIPAFDRGAERAALERELAQHKGNLHKLREQAAIYAAGETPLHLLNQIEAEEMEIRRIEEQLRGLENGDSSLDDGVSRFSLGEFTYPVPRYFVGRQDTLDQLLEAIQHNNVIVIGGMPGIGKTALAARLAENLNDAYPVLWLDSDPYGQFEPALVRMAEFLSQRFGDNKLAQVLRSPTASATRRAEAAIAALDAYRCLFIWDQFDQDRNQSLLPLLEMGSRLLRHGRLLITTRELMPVANLLNPPYRITLSGLDKESGLALMNHYLAWLGLREQPDELLSQAYERLNGHPYFMRQLMILAETFPLPDLLDEIPYFTNQAYRYIQEQVLGNLVPVAQQLLTRLAILRVPFQISAVKHLGNSPDSYNAFDVLLRKFVVTRQRKYEAYYEIHSLVREWCETEVSVLDLPAAHRKAVEYYQALPQKRYLDVWELTYHALEAGELDEAARAANDFLGHALYDGRYDLALDFISQLLQDDRTAGWGFVRHTRGRALRFKERLSEALDEYKTAMELAATPKDRDAAKFEMASILTKLARKPGDVNWQMAETYYVDLLESEDARIRIQALGVLGCLRADRGYPEEGVEQMLKALHVAEEAGWHRHVAEICYGLGTTYGHKFADPQKAIQYLERGYSIQRNKEFGGQDVEAEYHTLDALARFYNQIGGHTDAAHASAQCVEIDRRLELEHRLARSLYHLGREQCLLQQYESAYKNLQESLELIRKHDIQEGAERAALEWIAVVLWYLGDFEGAVECILEYTSACERDGVPSERHIVVKKSELLPDADPFELSEKGVHMLVLANKHDWGDVQRWTANVVKRRPDLAAVSRPLFLQKPQSSPDKPRVGRNDPCPCGSGKKYKHCCGRKRR